MTLRERLAHLHRRLGFGATPEELDRDEKLGFDRALDRLVDYERVDEEFPVSPWEFCWRDEKKDNGEPEEADIGGYRFRIHWTLRMMATERPLQEKLTLFWHGHFAAGDDKVEDGPMMLDYIEALRARANGRFSDLLAAASKAPAMMRYLDMTRSVRGNPNENFGREVMELFTLGINGGYTEDDVKEVSRALTGWGFVHLYWELPGNATDKVKDMLATRRPFSSFCYMPAMHDDGEKTILGQKRPWTGDEVLDHLARHPQTSRFVARKLWTYFAYEDPEERPVERVAEVFRKSQGDVKATVRALVRQPEFWSERCVRGKPKNPVEFVIGIARAQGIGKALLAMRGPKAGTETALPRKILDETGYASYRMEKAGLLLLVPPDVSGWRWGSSFISPSAMAERYQYMGHHIEVKDRPAVQVQNVIGWVRSKSPQSASEIVDRVLERYDVAAGEHTRTALVKMVEAAGGMDALNDEKRWDGLHWVAIKILAAAPETHVC